MRRFAFLLLLLPAACETHRVEPRAAAAAASETPPGHLEFVRAPDGDVAAWVRSERGELQAKGRSVLVYGGAAWCEPCERFHRAAADGKLNAAFPTLTLLEFDTDRDSERLAMAGYSSNLIPLFAAPGEDGRGTGRQIEGGIKGDGAVDEIVRRLRSLLDGHALR